MVDPVTDEMLAKFVVDSHFKSQPKGANLDENPLGESQDDIQASDRQVDPEVRTRDTTKSLIQFLADLFEFCCLLQYL